MPIMYFILSLLLLVSPAYATPTESPIEDLTQAELCGLVDIELWSAVDAEIISDGEATQISTRCWALTNF